jgi:hypothetical protein
VALRIEPAPGGMSMQVTGDIETQLAIPCDGAGRFLLGASDGTLLLHVIKAGLSFGAGMEPLNVYDCLSVQRPLTTHLQT